MESLKVGQQEWKISFHDMGGSEVRKGLETKPRRARTSVRKAVAVI